MSRKAKAKADTEDTEEGGNDMRRWRLLSTGFVAGKGEGDVLEEGEAGVEMLVSMYPHAVEELPSDDVVGGAECEASGPVGEGSREAEFAPT